MHTTALARLGQHTRALPRPHPLLSVMVWELRRFRASRVFWLQALGFFCLLLFVVWTTRIADQFSLRYANVTINGFVAGTSAWGLLEHIPTASLLLVLLLPFVTTDGVTRDLHRRTHELLMTTSLPTWAYVWGRYLVGLLQNLGLALLALAAILGMGWLLHLTVTDYPVPELGNLMILWIGMVVPATILVSSLSFALGTLLPRQSTLIKIAIMLGWFVGAVILPSGIGSASPPAWYSNWDPTSAATTIGILPPYLADFDMQTRTASSAAQFQSAVLTVENTFPGIGTWFVSHLIEALLSLLLVGLAAFAFRRFRNTFNG